MCDSLEKCRILWLPRRAVARPYSTHAHGLGHRNVFPQVVADEHGIVWLGRALHQNRRESRRVWFRVFTRDEVDALRSRLSG